MQVSFHDDMFCNLNVVTAAQLCEDANATEVFTLMDNHKGM
jgi:hypothetical protein